MGLLQSNDMLFAHKALNVMPGIAAATRQVAGAIIDHFNKKTGQCDPSIGRLMKLLALSRAAVLRATNELDELGLIEKDSHGGKSHRTSYSPNWARFREIVKDWDARMKSGDGPEKIARKVSDLKPSRSHGCDVNGVKNETQTLLKNQSNKPVDKGHAENSATQATHWSKSKRCNQLSKRSIRRGQTPMLLPIRGGKAPPRSEIARNKAQQRWESELWKMGEPVMAAVMEWLTEERLQAATQAELVKSGGGLDYIFTSLNQQASKHDGFVAASIEQYRNFKNA